MNKHSTLVSIVFVLALALASTMTGHAFGKEPARTVSPASARVLVVEYFQAVEAHRFRRACSLLGAALRAETGGAGCPSYLRRGLTGPLSWRVFGSQSAREGVGVRVRLGQNELDHVRMRTWLAIVRLEGGSLKIVETRLLR